MPDFTNDKISGPAFEASVRQVARQLYRHANRTGSIMLDGRERDEVIDTGTELIVIESTQSRKLQKTEHDLSKSIQLIKNLRANSRFSEYNFRIILITAEEPTADQNSVVKSAKAGCPKEIISFSTLFSRLFDARHYIRLRGDHFFGSVRDPANESNFNIPQSDYIPLALSESDCGASLKTHELAKRAQSGGRYIIYGDYGSGKSMTLRDIYYKLRDKFSSGEIFQCPIYLNLREHIAQTQPDEVLYRHAEKIGFREPHSLIAAWRSGFTAIILDGFDELTPPQFVSSVSNLREARRFAVEIVKRFIEQTPESTPILIAGRENYFDSRMEAKAALGYGAQSHVFDLAGFTDQDIKKFLKAKGSYLPAWLPTRPLLLGYLANAGLLTKDDELLSFDPAHGWDRMLERVCEREVNQIWGVGFEARDLRRFIEGIATRVRKSREGDKLEDSALRAVFRSVFGRDADEPASLLTMRLPGLGSVPGRPGAREFIDADFADAAGGGDLGRYIESPFADDTPLEEVQKTLNDLGRAIALIGSVSPAAQVSLALSRAGRDSRLATTSADLMSILIDQQIGYQGTPLTIEDANFDTVVIDPELDCSNITLSRCIISTIDFGRSSTSNDARNSPRFLDCMIDRVEGAMSAQDVPEGILLGTTTVETYAAFTATNDAIMKSILPDSVKVLLTILRKLFMQRGTGRQYSALRRGLPLKLIPLVDPIVAIVKAHGFASDITLDRRTILIPNRACSADALSIINGPNASTHPLIERIRAI